MLNNKTALTVLTMLLLVSRQYARSATPTAIGSISISGSEQLSGSSYDTGAVAITVNGVAASVAYAQDSTPDSIASGLAALISSSCNYPVYAHATGATISFYPRGGNIVSATTISVASNDPALFPSSSFTAGVTSAGSLNVVPFTYSLSQGPVTMGVVISGGGFGATQGASTVSINGLPMTVVPGSWSANQIIVQVPGGATPGNIVITVNGVAMTGAVFTVTPAFGCS